MTTMSASLPIIEHLRNAGSTNARGDLVLRMPLLILGNYIDEIDTILTEAGDEAALNYVRSQYAELASVRDATGAIPPEKRTVTERIALLTSMEVAHD